MQELIGLYRYNAWANERVFSLAEAVDARLLEADAPGTRGTVKGTLAHLARVEYLYVYCRGCAGSAPGSHGGGRRSNRWS